jgi:hypothetical protein
MLGGSGFLVLGAAAALRFVRDYSATRRLGAVKADLAEASAVREDLRTDLFRWVVGEVQAGRMLVPPADLLRLLSDADVQALNTLARSDVALDLPGTVTDRVTEAVAAVSDGRRAG